MTRIEMGLFHRQQIVKSCSPRFLSDTPYFFGALDHLRGLLISVDYATNHHMLISRASKAVGYPKISDRRLLGIFPQAPIEGFPQAPGDAICENHANGITLSRHFHVVCVVAVRRKNMYNPPIVPFGGLFFLMFQVQFRGRCPKGVRRFVLRIANPKRVASIFCGR